MKFIKELNDNKDIFYEVKTVRNCEVINEYSIYCKSTAIKKDNKIYYLLFNRHYELNKNVFNFINIYQDSFKRSEQTKGKTLVALKLLYSFLEIFNLKLEYLTNDDAAQFLAFMFGYSVAGSCIFFEFKSSRTPSSVNDYLSIIRTYIKYLRLDKNPLLEATGKKKLMTTLDGQQIEVSAFDIKAKEYHKIEVPKHITLDEFKQMQLYLHNGGNKKLECIIRLMYESGLRSGEVLSLTYEDLKMEKRDGLDIYKVILRNRFGNTADRSPKFLMKIKSKVDYKSPSYRQKGYGWNEMMISKSLYEMLLDYIDEAHSDAQDNHFSCWKKAITDSVDEDFSEENNFFIFLNKYGKPLSRKTLETEVRQLFIDCGIKINKEGGKYDGLCHRFRHGFAMYQVNYNHTPMALLKELMRHTSIESTAVYYTPEATDIIKIKNNLSKSVYDFIPEFDLSRED